jgi:Domain of unknown function (DUF4388)
MSFAGRLEDNELPELLHYISLNKKTGKLSLTRRDAQGLIVVRLGRILYAASSSVRETFGNILVCHGLLSEAILSEALEKQHSEPEPRRLGWILIEMEKLTEKDITEILRQQIGLVVLELCRWKAGYFKFEAVAIAAEGEIGVDAEDFVVAGGVNTEEVLVQALTRLDEDVSANPPATEGAAAPGGSEPDAEPARLQEIAKENRSPALRGEITLNLMRSASRLVSRGLLLVVRGDEVQGTVNFGLTEDDRETPVRNIRVPLGEPSVFSDVIDRRETYRGPLLDVPENRRFVAMIGGSNPREVVVVPMMVRESVELIFYGDNLPDGKPIGPTEELEMAMTEASLAMEREALEQRIRDFDRARGRAAEGR